MGFFDARFAAYLAVATLVLATWIIRSKLSVLVVVLPLKSPPR
jgi:hypothetical protein